MRHTIGVIERAPGVGEASVPDVVAEVVEDHAPLAWFIIVYGASTLVACAVLGLVASALI
jgi:hypothetical protein